MSAIVAGSKYGAVQTRGLGKSAGNGGGKVRDSRSSPLQMGGGPGGQGGGKGKPGMPAIFIPTLTNTPMMQDWYWKELREGGILHQYVARERALSGKRLRAVARRMHPVKRNLKSDFQLKASVPAREFFRWRAQDPHFWEDDKNLQSFKRDNPDAVVFV